MHSIPPLVTISSARSGRRPCSCSWRSIRYSRTLAIPSHGVYCSATAASSRTSRAAISSTSSVGNVAGLGKPPVMREHARRAAGEDRGQLVAAAQARPASERVREVRSSTRKASALASPRSSAATCSSWFVRPCSASPRACAARIARSLRPISSAVSSAAPIRCAGRSTGRRRRRTRCRPGTPRRRRRRSSPRARRARRVVPDRGVVPRANTGSPMRRRPAHVAAEPVGDDPRQPAPARLAGEQLAEDRARPAVGGDHEHVARRGGRERAHHRQMVVLGHDRERRPGHPHVGDHRAHRVIDHRQRLVGVRERGDVDSPAAARSGPRRRACQTRRDGSVQARALDHRVDGLDHVGDAPADVDPGRDCTRDDRPRPPMTNRTAGHRRCTPPIEARTRSVPPGIVDVMQTTSGRRRLTAAASASVGTSAPSMRTS